MYWYCPNMQCKLGECKKKPVGLISLYVSCILGTHHFCKKCIRNNVSVVLHATAVDDILFHLVKRNIF